VCVAELPAPSQLHEFHYLVTTEEAEMGRRQSVLPNVRTFGVVVVGLPALSLSMQDVMGEGIHP
jgi:hypothetical protein